MPDLPATDADSTPSPNGQGLVSAPCSHIVWVEPPECPKCARPLVECVMDGGDWRCPHHLFGKCMWWDYELTMILRASRFNCDTPETSTNQTP